MSYVIQKLSGFPVTFGSLTLWLAEYQLSGNSAVRESGAADGQTVLAGYWKKGCHLRLKGKIPPDKSAEQIILALAQNLLSRQTLSLGTLCFSNAMLCSYSVTEQQNTPEMLLLFYCPDTPAVIQEEQAS